MPTTNPLLKLFSHSPFKPLQEHMRVVVQCADEVPKLIEFVDSLPMTTTGKIMRRELREREKTRLAAAERAD